jgi:hypothetical protein
VSTTDDYDYIVGDESYSVRVPDHTVDTQRTATDVIAAAFAGLCRSEAPGAFVWLDGQAFKSLLQQHTTDPSMSDDPDCSCEDIGWWCTRGDGEVVAFWSFERRHVSALHGRAADEADAAVPSPPREVEPMDEVDEPITLRRIANDLFGTDPTDCLWCRCCKKALCKKAIEDGTHCIVLVQAGREDTVRDCPCIPPSSSPVDEGTDTNG